ncbi:MAG: hypothetical protein EXQ71_00830 [Acidimicrobiia bacterium]|nr:hypothetical protein [Acidimicrobiia bacterium]
MPGPPGLRRIRIAVCPLVSSERISALPISPLEPVIAIRTLASLSIAFEFLTAADTTGGKVIDELKKVIVEFKKFLFQGNVVGLASAVVIGVTFTAFISAITSELVTPLIGVVFDTDFKTLTFTWRRNYFFYGRVIDAGLTLLATLLVLFFLILKPSKAIAARRLAGEADDEERNLSEETLVLREIRDLLKPAPVSD